MMLMKDYVPLIVQKIQLIIVVVCLLGGMDCVTLFYAESLNYRLMHESRSVIE